MIQTKVSALKSEQSTTDSRPIAIVCSRFNHRIVAKLHTGAVKGLVAAGIDKDLITTITVPGAFELVTAVKALLDQDKYVAIITLGVIIRGETPHFEYISTACAQGISNLASNSTTPVTFGVLTVDNINQARERAADNNNNKGFEAAQAATAMIQVLKQINQHDSFDRKGRVNARRHTLQALYQWLITGKSIKEVIAEFENDATQLNKTDVDYFKVLLQGTVAHTDELNGYIATLLDRKLDALDTIERAILYIGCYELKYQLEIPYRVIIHEAIELAKLFGAEQSYKYINGVLDNVASQLRAGEIHRLDG